MCDDQALVGPWQLCDGPLRISSVLVLGCLPARGTDSACARTNRSPRTFHQIFDLTQAGVIRRWAGVVQICFRSQLIFVKSLLRKLKVIDLRLFLIIRFARWPTANFLYLNRCACDGASPSPSCYQHGADAPAGVSIPANERHASGPSGQTARTCQIVISVRTAA